MAGYPSGSGNGGDLSMGPALEQLRKDNALANVVHDPEEDAPKIVGIPKKFRHSAPASTEDPEQPHS